MANISWCPDAESAAKAWNNRASGWIPCSERLPEEIDGESKAVLAVVQLTDFNGIVYSENYQIVWREEGEWACRGKVTHWMPLPEPPERED